MVTEASPLIYNVLSYSGVVLIALGASIVLAVIIACYPKTLERAWRRECHEFLKLPAEDVEKHSFFFPLQICEKCRSRLSIRERLKGQCSQCHAPIARLWQLALILLTVVASLGVYAKFGLHLHALFIGLFIYALIVLSFIDQQEGFLPDSITLGFLWIGLTLNASYPLLTDAKDAIYGAAASYLLLWLLSVFSNLIHKLLRKDAVEFAHGDAKMFALVGAWLGLSHLFKPIIAAVVLQVLTLIILAPLVSRFNISFKLRLASALAIATCISLLSN